MSYDIAAVKSGLLATPEKTIAYLMGDQGQRQGRNLCYGGIEGDRGKSFQVDVDTGLWNEHNKAEAPERDSGDILHLWQIKRGLPTLKDTIDDAAQWLGFTDDELQVGIGSRHYPVPEKPVGISVAWDSNPGEQYLRCQRRLAPETIKKYSICYINGALVFPYVVEGIARRFKYLKIAREDGRKVMWTEPKAPDPCPPVLFGWQALDADAREVIITEGEIDAASAYQLTELSALSMPNGIGSLDWIAYEYDRLKQFEKIYLWVDREQKSQSMVQEIVERLGAYRTYILNTPEPHKDANDLLQADWLNGPELLCRAELLKLPDTVLLPDIRADIHKEYDTREFEAPGITVPWEGIQDKLYLRPAELIILAGVNSHGKTELSTQMALHAMKEDSRVFIASLEWQITKFVKRMLRQAGAAESPTTQYVDHMIDYFADRLVLFNTNRKAKVDRLLYVMGYCRLQFGIDLYVIDNMTKLVGVRDDDAQQDLVNQLSDFANKHNTCVMLIAHMRKADSEDSPGNMMDVRGSGSITDLAKTVITIWRNKSKEAVKDKAASGGVDSLDEKELKLYKKSDAVLRVPKQNDGAYVGSTGLLFDERTHQFVEWGKQPVPYVPSFSTQEEQG